MKTTTTLIAMLGMLSVGIFSCDEDPVNNEGAARIQFQLTDAEMNENDAESVVVIQLTRPAAADATITLKTSEGFEDVLHTDPQTESGLIHIAIAKGSASASVKLHPVDNLLKTGNKVLNLTLHSLPDAYIMGANQSLSITVKDDEITNPVSIANFVHQEIVLEETNTGGVEYQIHLSEAPASASVIKIELSSEKASYDAHYTTEPAAENNALTLPVSAGESVITFKVMPVNNNEITGELNVKFTITQTTSPIAKGEIIEQTLTIMDEELAGKPKGYEITAAGMVAKRFYEYDAQGRIAKVRWENYTPFLTQGTETYYYDENNNITRINKHPHKDIIYHRSNGRIVKSEDVSDGVVTSYTEYEYDEAGNIGGHVSYERQDNGTYTKGLFTLYLYFLDGNIYKSMTYQDSQDPEEPFLVRTRTYDNYIDVSNPFPMAEVLPAVNQQPKLATSYRVEESGTDLTYQMVYEYRPDGQPARRIATATGDTQTAVYYYY